MTRAFINPCLPLRSPTTFIPQFFWQVQHHSSSRHIPSGIPLPYEVRINSVRATPTCAHASSTRPANGNNPHLPSKRIGRGDGRAPISIRPKQSLGQNFLRDENIIRRIVSAFAEARAESIHPNASVVEVGPGVGALTQQLMPLFPDMHAVEIDQRAIAVLRERYPALNVVHGDVLDIHWGALAHSLTKKQSENGVVSADGAITPLAVIGNLPYNIVSQILLSLLEAPNGTVSSATVMMQREVAQRIVANPRCKAYGILSVLSQLYARPQMLFDVPPTAFYPKPGVFSAMVHLEIQPCEGFAPLTGNLVLMGVLRRVVRTAFGQRRKMLRNALRLLVEECGVDVPEEWEEKRAEELKPMEFVALAQHFFSEGNLGPSLDTVRTDGVCDGEMSPVWRPS